MYYVYMYVYMWVLWCITYSCATTGVNIYLSSIETQVTIASNSTVTNMDSVNYFDPFLNFQTSQPTQGTTTTSAISVLLPSINPRNIGSACPGKEDVEICLRLMPTWLKIQNMYRWYILRRMQIWRKNGKYIGSSLQPVACREPQNMGNLFDRKCPYRRYPLAMWISWPLLSPGPILFRNSEGPRINTM